MMGNEGKNAERRKRENEDKIRRMRAGEPLQAQAESSWWPPDTTRIKKDKNALKVLPIKPVVDNLVGLRKGEKIALCPIDCPYLKPKEAKQNRNKFDPHWCIKYDKQVRHFGQAPNIVKLEECIKEIKDESNT